MSRPSRIEAAHARVRGAKRGILVAAACTFAVAMGLARITHPGTSSGASQPPASANTVVPDDTGAATDEFFGQSDDSSGGWIAPSSGPPQVQTQTS